MIVGIIGNGILSTLTAYRLLPMLERHDQIVIIGPKERPHAGSLAAAAMLNSFAEVESHTLKADLGPERLAHSQEAARLWPELVAKVNQEAKADCKLGMGTHILNNTCTDVLEDENFNSIVAALEEFDEPYEMVEPSEIVGYNPEPTSRARKALFIPREGFIEPRPFLEALDVVLKSDPRVSWVDEFATAVTKQGASEFQIECEKLSLSVDKILIAAGSATQDILASSFPEIQSPRILAGVGITLRIKLPGLKQETVIRTPNRGLACGIYTAPYANDEMIIGATNAVTSEPWELPTLGNIYSVLKNAMEQINMGMHDASLVRWNLGRRPVSSDGVPLIAVDTSGAVICTGTRRDGWHLAPLISLELARAIVSGSFREDFEIYSARHRPYRLISREESVERLAQEYVNAMYQHGYSMPKGPYADYLKDNYRLFFENLHDRMSASDFGIPVDLAAFVAAELAAGRKPKI